MKTKIRTFAVTGALAIGASLPAVAGPARQDEVDTKVVAPVEGSTDLQSLIRYFREQRSDFLLARQQLRQDLAAAETDEQRRLILRNFFEQNRERIREQAEMRRELRRRQLEIRRQRRHGGSGG